MSFSKKVFKILSDYKLCTIWYTPSGARLDLKIIKKEAMVLLFKGEKFE